MSAITLRPEYDFRGGVRGCTWRGTALSRKPGATTRRDPFTTGDGGTIEELVEAGNGGYLHACVRSENVPARPVGARQARTIMRLECDHEVTSEEAITEAARLGLERSRRVRRRVESGLPCRVRGQRIGLASGARQSTPGAREAGVARRQRRQKKMPETGCRAIAFWAASM